MIVIVIIMVSIMSTIGIVIQRAISLRKCPFIDPLNTGKTILEGFDPNPPTGIEEEIIKRENKEISIFPNPVLDDLNINTDDIIRSLSIFDMRGKLVYSKSNYNSSTFSLSIGDWMSGVYTVVLNVADKKVTEKFSKK